MMARYQIFYIVLGYLIAYLYALKFAVTASQEENRAQFARINKIHEGCVLGCKAQDAQCQNDWWTSLTQYRGKNYYIGLDKTPNRFCFATFWSMSHFILYAFLGYMAPDYFWTTFLIGAAFEWYEHEYYDCHDLLDIGFNTAGFLVGRLWRG